MALIEQMTSAVTQLDAQYKEFQNSTLGKLVTEGFKKIYEEVLSIDSAMSDLRKVTQETDKTYTQFLDNAAEKAVRLNGNITDFVKQTTAWAKHGYRLDTSALLSENTMLYAGIGGISQEEAAANLDALMKNFNISASDSIQIIDRLTNMSNLYALSLSGLGSELEAVSGFLAGSGATLDQALALVTTLTQITGNAGEAGNILHTIQNNLNGSTAGLSVGQIQAKVQALTNTDNTGGFDILNGSALKSIYEILKGIGSVWQDMSDTDQTALLALIAGDDYSSSVDRLLTDMTAVHTALVQSQTSSGAAYQAQEQAMDSLTAKTQEFQTAFQSLSQNVLDSGILQFLTDIGTGAVSALDSITEAFGVIPTLAAGLSLKNVGRVKLYGYPSF